MLIVYELFFLILYANGIYEEHEVQLDISFYDFLKE